MSVSKRWRISIEGTVQGVGFRPFIWRLAGELKLCGHVFNHSEGVTVEAEGAEATLSTFIKKIDCSESLRHSVNHQIFRFTSIAPASDNNILWGKLILPQGVAPWYT